MAATKALVHGIANCCDCQWECQDYLTVQRKAANHAKRRHHKVSVDLSYAVTYDEREGAADGR